MRGSLVVAAVLGLVLVASCSSDDDDSSAPTGGAHSSGDRVVTEETADPDALGPAIADLLAAERPLAIAHAGGERDYPKETLYAFGEAVDAGADMLEMDVHLSADGQIVLIHDDTVDATTDGRGRVADMTADELAELDAAHWFVPDCGTCHDQPEDEYPLRGVRTGDQPPPDGYEADDFGVTTLRAVASRFREVALDIEIKPEGADGVATAEALATELRDLGRTGSAVVVSFDQATVEAFRQAAPEVAVSPGVDGITNWFAQTDTLDGYVAIQVPPTYEGVAVVTPETVARAHEDGLAVWVWMNEANQETPEFYAELFAMGVDGIIGDHPQVLADLTRQPA